MSRPRDVEETMRDEAIEEYKDRIREYYDKEDIKAALSHSATIAIKKLDDAAKEKIRKDLESGYYPHIPRGSHLDAAKYPEGTIAHIVNEPQIVAPYNQMGTSQENNLPSWSRWKEHHPHIPHEAHIDAHKALIAMADKEADRETLRLILSELVKIRKLLTKRKKK